MSKKILVILGHPNKQSYNAALADAYIEGASSSGAEVKYLKLVDLKYDYIFDPSKNQPLEPDLKKAQDLITWADHLVFIFPTWWGNMPSLMKSFIERTFIPGFAYKFTKKAIIPQKRYFKGKTARLIITFDGPRIFYKIFQIPGAISLKYYTLIFCGISKFRTYMVGSIKFSTDEKRKYWLKKVGKLGERNI